MCKDDGYYCVLENWEDSFQVLDFADIVGSVGGSLGLFLGFSCYAAATELIKKLKNCN